MNWLAHALLSPPDPEVRLGNLLADVVKGRDRKAMPHGFLAGIRRHQVIDRYTDWHPVFYRSRRRFTEDFARFGAVLVDVFYDHFLARHWARYAEAPLERFTADVYDHLGRYAHRLPPFAREVAARMIADDRLTSYREIGGVESALARLSARIFERCGRTVELERSVDELRRHYGQFESDFLAFFPDLHRHIARLDAAAPDARNSAA